MNKKMSSIYNWIKAINIRWIWVLLSASVGIIFFLFIYVHMPILNPDIIKNVGFWNFLIIILGSPVAFIIWYYRDKNNIEQLENQRKDINLKDFQKLAEWVSGVNIVEDKISINEKTITDKENKITVEKSETIEKSKPDSNSKFHTISKRDGSIALQIAAIYQLEPYILGDYGKHFKRPAFHLLKSTWQLLVEEYIDKYRISLDNDVSTSFKERELIKYKIVNSPLANAITAVVASNKGYILRECKDDLQHIILALMRLEDIDLNGLDLSFSGLIEVDFSRASLVTTNFHGAALDGARFSKANLQKANFSYSNLAGASFSRALSRKANFSYANLAGVGFNDTDLRGANFSYANLNATCENWKHVNLGRGIGNFYNADIRGADFTNAYIEGMQFNDKTKTDDNTKIVVYDEHNKKVDADATINLRLKLKETGLILPDWMYSSVNKPS